MSTWIIILIVIIIIIVLIGLIVIIKIKTPAIPTINTPITPTPTAYIPSKNFIQHPYLTPDIIKTEYKECSPCKADNEYAFAIYGVNDKYNSKILDPNQSVNCDDKVFGDPAYGIEKKCYIKNIPNKEIVPELKIKDKKPEDYTYIVGSDGAFKTTNPTYIAYGADGKYSTMYVPSNQTEICSDKKFGDPIFGITKACYAKVI